jgi:riboflavin kinase/FMN adenylyltransferase
MQHFWSIEPLRFTNCWATIGSFDGVHTGHQQIVKELVAGAHEQNIPAVVLTFYPHPAAVLGRRKGAFYLTTPEQRAQILGSLGVDAVISHPFNKHIASLSAEDFMSRLSDKLHLTSLWVGYDFALGRDRQGDVRALSEIGKNFGYTVHVIEPYQMGDDVVSSTRIREALQSGQVEEAALLLGRPYALKGEVIPGDARGRTIGIPTANIQTWDKQVLPQVGVYACRASVGGQLFGAMTNIGFRPTFDNQPPVPRLEAHLLDFDGDLYGKQLEVRFIARLRDEMRFSGIEALVTQVKQDIQRGKEILAKY